MTCTSCGDQTLLRAGAGIVLSGSGSAANPYVIGSDLLDVAVLEVRDTSTVNLSLAGAGTLSDPYVLRADTSSAAKLTQLGDADTSPVSQGVTPVWSGSAASGSWTWRPNGTWFVTSSTMPTSADRYPGLRVKQTDTGKYFEWNGTSWDDITPTTTTTIAAGSLTGTLNDSTLPARLQQLAEFLTTQDLNTILQSGWYRGTGLPHAPATGWFYYEVIGHSSAYAVQLAHSFVSTITYKRVLNNGVWSAWDVLRSTATIPASQAGHVTTSNMVADTGSRGGYSQLMHVTFAAGRFRTVPAVTLGIESGGSTDQQAGVVNKTTTGCDIYYWRTSVRNGTSVDWTATEEG